MKREIIKQAVMIRYKSGEYGVKITASETLTNLRCIRALSNSKRRLSGEYWTCSLSFESVERLQNHGFQLHPALATYLQKAPTGENKEIKLKIPGLKMELFNFQKQGVQFIEDHGGRALLGSEMGLGKTVQALAWCQLHPENRPVIIIVPASLKLNWMREVERWMTDYDVVEILNGTKPHKITGDIVIINYDILTYWTEQLIRLKPALLIVDEIHFCKANKTLRTKAVKKLAKHTKYFIGLSGTPIVNRPIEFYNVIQMIDPTLFPNWRYFTHRYCAAKHNGFGWDYSGASNTEELHQRLISTIMLRHKKEDVLQDLPPKIYSFIPIELTNREEYNTAEQDFIQFIKIRKGAIAAERASNAAALAKVEGLKQLAVHGKMNQMIEWIWNVVESGEKLIVFAVHKFVIDRLMEEFKTLAVKVDGDVSGPKRQLAVDNFQNNAETRLFVGNIQAAGVGITLTAASNVAFAEYPWTPGALAQASDRPHRIGQKDTVNIYYLLAENTIEERIAALLDSKRKVLDAVLDGQAPEEGSLLMELIDNY